MHNLIIIGARGYGREIFALVPFCRGYGKEFVVKGFLDSKMDALSGFDGYAPILAAPESYTPVADDVFICAMGDVKWRKHYVEIMQNKHAKFISLIHNNAGIGKNIIIGAGCFIRENVPLTADIKVGNHSALFDYTFVGHDCIIGDFCHLHAQTFLGGGVTLENGVVMHAGSRVVPHKKIEEGSTVGAGSAVIRNVKAGVTVFGIPAVQIW